MTTKVQSDVHGGSKAPWKGLKTQAWSERTPKYAFKSASPGEKRTLGAQLRPKPGMATSNPVDPGPLEMTAIAQSDVRGGSKTPGGGLKTRAWSARIPQYAFKSASPGEKRALGAQLRPKPGMAASNPVDPGPLEMTTIAQSDERGGSNKPWGRQKLEHGAHASPRMLSSRLLQVKNALSELSYDQNRAWPPRTQWTPVP